MPVAGAVAFLLFALLLSVLGMRNALHSARATVLTKCIDCAHTDFLPISVTMFVILWVIGMAAFLQMAISKGTQWVDNPRLIKEH
jgi:prepilin signal peptidase PulO-like enzyme (type II secretory pathway)